MKGNITVLVVLLILSLLNFEYSSLSNFEFERKDYLGILMVLVSIFGIFYELKSKNK